MNALYSLVCCLKGRNDLSLHNLSSFILDINECAADESPCTDDGTECRNHRGWFSCPCKLGFVKRYDKCVEEGTFLKLFT